MYFASGSGVICVKNIVLASENEKVVRFDEICDVKSTALCMAGSTSSAFNVASSKNIQPEIPAKSAGQVIKRQLAEVPLIRPHICVHLSAQPYETGAACRAGSWLRPHVFVHLSAQPL